MTTLMTLGMSSVSLIVNGSNLGKGQRLELIVRDDGIYIPLTEQDPPAKAYNQAEVTWKKSHGSCLALPSSWIFGSELLFDGILLVS